MPQGWHKYNDNGTKPNYVIVRETLNRKGNSGEGQSWGNPTMIQSKTQEYTYHKGIFIKYLPYQTSIAYLFIFCNGVLTNI
jgi:hypothetical protein